MSEQEVPRPTSYLDYRYHLIPTLEERHEVEAAMAIRRLIDTVDKLTAENKLLKDRLARRRNT